MVISVNFINAISVTINAKRNYSTSICYFKRSFTYTFKFYSFACFSLHFITFHFSIHIISSSLHLNIHHNISLKISIFFILLFSKGHRFFLKITIIINLFSQCLSLSFSIFNHSFRLFFRSSLSSSNLHSSSSQCSTSTYSFTE